MNARLDRTRCKQAIIRTGLGLLLVLTLVAAGGCQASSSTLEPPPTPVPPTATHTAVPTATPTATATATSTPTPEPTATATPSATPTPTVTSTATPQPALIVLVVDADSGSPINRARVQLAKESAFTGGQGQARFDGIDQGNYTLTVTADGYQESSVEVEVMAGENEVKTNLVPRIYAEISIDAGNLRAGPGTVYAVMGKVQAGDRLEVVGKSEDGEWLVVASGDGTAAWLSSGACTLEGALYRVEAVKAPPTPTPAPPTAVPTPAPTPTPDVVVYPQSSIEPWNLAAFQKRLQELHKSFFDGKQWLSGALQARRFYCGNYANLYDSWVTSAVYQNVPPEWMPLYREYRSMIEGAVTLTHSMYNLCMTGGGQVLVIEVELAYAHIDASEIRLLEMMKEAGIP